MFTTTFFRGKVKPLCCMADITRSALSFTAVSGSPTITYWNPVSVTTSIVMGMASIPCRAAP